MYLSLGCGVGLHYMKIHSPHRQNSKQQATTAATTAKTTHPEIMSNRKQQMEPTTRHVLTTNHKQRMKRATPTNRKQATK